MITSLEDLVDVTRDRLDVSARDQLENVSGRCWSLLYLAYTWIHLSIGRADRLLRWGIVELTVICLLFVAALPWGPVGIATAWVISSGLLVMPALW